MESKEFVKNWSDIQCSICFHISQTGLATCFITETVQMLVTNIMKEIRNLNPRNSSGPENIAAK